MNMYARIACTVVAIDFLFLVVSYTYFLYITYYLYLQ